MKKVGRYVVIDELGRGAMGIVYKASDPTIGRHVALKVLTFDSSTDEGTQSPQEMFMREVRAAGRLAHPSIVIIYDAFEDAETKSSCIVMELVAGRTLESILMSGQGMTVEETLNLVRQVAEGLDYAHRNQVVHRDLKPANILVTEDGYAKITDFGIAKVLAREAVARTVGVMGTPSYMSPEQVKGGEIDARTDLFSLGIILFLMLTGQKPFTGDTASVMFKIVYEEPPLPSKVNPRLSSAHDYVSLKCLAKDRDQRYSSARELLNDLDDLQHGRPPRSREVALPPPPAPAAPVLAEQTLVNAVPILSTSAPYSSPARSTPPPHAASPPAPIDAPSTISIREHPAKERGELAGEADIPAPPKSKSSAVSIILGVVVVLLVIAAGFAYLKYHQIMSTQAPPPQIARSSPPSAPSDLGPVEPAPSAPEVVTNPVPRTPRSAVNAQPQTEAPPTVQPQPAPPAEQPPTYPAVAAPGTEDVAKTQAAKFAGIPHVIQVHCHYDLKEASYTFSGGGQTLFQGSFKGKRKGGFFGIKGAYEGSFSRTITIPAGVAEISVRVVTKDGSTDLNRVTALMGPGGFVPTLNVQVTEDKIAATWQNSSKAKP
jgi:serine/threonine protein kinase